ncbi:MAG: amidohydrolase family protein [Geobacteraceae bacterium]|nr:amidohydrolase family protein [Geobacteraceae bacterium]
MNNYLRTYAYVRNRLHNLKRIQSDIDRSLKTIVPPPAYVESLESSFPAGDIFGPADILIKNARIFSAASISGQADTIAIKNKRLAYIGNDSAGLTDSRTVTIDAGGCSVIPGLCDAHVHLMVGAEHHQGCSVEDVDDPDTLRSRIRIFVQQHPDFPVYYVYGLHYMDDPLIPPKQARQMLDEIVSDKPLFVYAHDLHTGWANTRALEIADLMHRMPPCPEFIRELDLCGNIELDENGYPSGELREPLVYFLVEEALRRRFPLTVEQKKSYLEQACYTLASLGLTSVHTMGLGLPEEDIECLMLLVELEAEDRLPLRVHVSYSIVPDEMMLEDVLQAADVRNHLEQARQGHITLPDLHRHLFEVMKTVLQMRQGEKRLQATDPLTLWHRFKDDFSQVVSRLHVAEHGRRGEQLYEKFAGKRVDPVGKVQGKAVKLFMDGVVEKDTAFRLDHHPLPGIPAFSPRELDQVVLLADRLGLQTAAHCIGNGSVNAMLNSIELARQKNADIDRQRGRKVRHRIEHIEMCTAFDIPRFRELEVIASMQALHERAPMTLWHEKVPEIEWSTAFAWKSLIESGATLVFGSDWPIVSCNCFEGIQRATERKPWKAGMIDQHLTLEQALSAFSSQAAEAEYNENIKGKIQVGMLADLVILLDNLDKYRGDYSKVAVAYTVCDGTVVYAGS